MISNQSKKLKIICSLFIILSVALMSLGAVSVSSAQSDEELQLASTSPATDSGNFSNPYLVRTFVDEEGREIDEVIVPGRPPEIKAAVATLPEPNLAMGINILSNVPVFDWSYGCSATSAAMMMGYYDNTGYPNMYAGSTNGGLCPMDNSVWGQTWWVDEWYSECPLSATHQGVDGRATRGHVDDYWIDFGSTAPDPFIGNWEEHTYGDCTGDYMGSNQYRFGNTDGATTFYFDRSGAPLYDYTECEPAQRDGCHGLKLFVESRGYTVVANFSQYIYGRAPLNPYNGFTFSDFCSEIDAGRPVLIQVEGHTMLGYGYNTAGQIIYIHNTWDHNNYSMTWGGIYEGRQHYAVTVIQLLPTGQPDITVSPPSFDVTLPPNTIQDHTLTIGNDGGATLTYSISDRETTGGLSVAGGESLSLIEPASIVLDVPLESKPVEPKNTVKAQAGWQNIMTDGFEGAFPGDWDVHRSTGYADAYWGKDNYNSHSGSYSVFCAKSGSAGVNPPADYPNNMEAWMIYGPFSLADATDAELNFYCWLDTEYDYDYLEWMASINGQDFYGWSYTGNSDGWESESFDLTDVYTLGNLCGQSQVWIALIFESDEFNTGEGAFIDDVVLRKYVSAANNPPNTPSSPSPANHALGMPVNTDLSWTGGDPDVGDTVTYDVYFGTSSTPPLVSNDQSGTTYDLGTLAYNTKYYWKVIATDNHAASTMGLLWDFTTGIIPNNPPNTPSSPSPANHATGMSVNTDLSWTGGDPDVGDTVTYDVYFGTSSTPPLVSNDQSGTTYDPGTLAYNTKYYWKIIATDNHAASTTGPLWDFTTVGGTGDCPWLDENPKSGSVPAGGSNDITVTINTAGLTVGNTYTVEIVIDNNDPDENPKVVPVTLHVVPPVDNNPPNPPSNPSPANHATGMSVNTDLSWTGGDPDAGDTVTYDVYFGTSSSPPLVSNDQSGTTYDPGTLAYTKYYWKIIATDNHGASTAGPLWDFTTGLASNSPPQLSSPSVQPPSGTPATDFYYYVNYFDSDGDSPSVKQVYIDGSAYTMSLYSGSASNGVYRYGPKNISVGWGHNYYFYFEDGKGGTARLPSSGGYSGPTIIEWDPWGYDGNRDGIIQKGEALQAIVDYFDTLITKTQVMEVLQLYFASV